MTPAIIMLLFGLQQPVEANVQPVHYGYEECGPRCRAEMRRREERREHWRWNHQREIERHYQNRPYYPPPNHYRY